MKNYGFKLDTPSEKDYVFGSFLPYEELQPNGDWTPFLPKAEYQNTNDFEPYCCVTETILNCVEILIKQQYGEEVNYSDRFLASISGTKNGGNTPRTVADFLRILGVVPEDVYPFKAETFDEFYQPIPEELKTLAKEFVDNWEFKYESVPTNMIETALKSSPLGVSVYAWVDKDGVFYNPNQQDNHFTTLYKIDDHQHFFDSYANDGSPLKLGDKNMAHSSIQRYYVKKRIKPIETNWITDLFTRLSDFIIDICNLFWPK